MKKELKQGSTEFECFGDIFTLYKSVGTVEDSVEYWQDVMDKIDAYIRKHDTPLGRELALAIMAVLNEETTEQRYDRLITQIALKAYDDQKVAKDFISQAILVAKKWKWEE